MEFNNYIFLIIKSLMVDKLRFEISKKYIAVMQPLISGAGQDNIIMAEESQVP